jgi:hypothetical protein
LVRLGASVVIVGGVRYTTVMVNSTCLQFGNDQAIKVGVVAVVDG